MSFYAVMCQGTKVERSELTTFIVKEEPKIKEGWLDDPNPSRHLKLVEFRWYSHLLNTSQGRDNCQGWVKVENQGLNSSQGWGKPKAELEPRVRKPRAG